APVELDAVVQDLKKRKILVNRGVSNTISFNKHQRSSELHRKTRFSHTFKSFQTLFRPGTITKPSRVMKTLQSISSAIRKALSRFFRSEISSSHIMLEKDIESTTHGCITCNWEGPVDATNALVPIMGIDSHDVHLTSNQVRQV